MIERFDPYKIVNYCDAWRCFFNDQMISYNIVKEEILSNIISKPKLIDAACGLGIGYEILNSYCNYEGWDISDEAIKICRERYPNGVFTKTDLDKPFTVEDVDVFVSIATGEHLSSPANFFFNISQCLSDNGLFFFYVPTCKSMDIDPYHKRDWTTEQWEKELVNNGFKIIKKGNTKFLTSWKSVCKIERVNLKDKIKIFLRSVKYNYVWSRLYNWFWLDNFEWKSSWFICSRA